MQISRNSFFENSFYNISIFFSIFPIIFENITKYLEPKRKKNINFYNRFTDIFINPTFIINNLYIGNIYNVYDKKLLNNLNITDIINISTEIPNYYPNDYNYCNINIQDNGIDELTIDDIKLGLNVVDSSMNNCMISCYSGNSRSVAFAICYLIKKKKYSIEKAYDFLNNCRSSINPSIYLIECCSKYEQYLKEFNNVENV